MSEEPRQREAWKIRASCPAREKAPYSCDLVVLAPNAAAALMLAQTVMDEERAGGEVKSWDVERFDTPIFEWSER